MKITISVLIPFPASLPAWASEMNPTDRMLTVKPNCGYLAERGIGRWAKQAGLMATGWEQRVIRLSRKGVVLGACVADGPTY